MDASASIWKAVRFGLAVLAAETLPRGADVARFAAMYASPRLRALLKTASYVASGCSVA